MPLQYYPSHFQNYLGLRNFYTFLPYITIRTDYIFYSFEQSPASE
nr:MAG TPA: hypothetical protein [Caudoviricetes sp.]